MKEPTINTGSIDRKRYDELEKNFSWMWRSQGGHTAYKEHWRIQLSKSRMLLLLHKAHHRQPAESRPNEAWALRKPVRCFCYQGQTTPSQTRPDQFQFKAIRGALGPVMIEGYWCGLVRCLVGRRWQGEKMKRRWWQKLRKSQMTPPSLPPGAYIAYVIWVSWLTTTQ